VASGTAAYTRSEHKRSNLLIFEGFFYNGKEKGDILQYGLVQLQGGPCGIIACVQAFILKHLLFMMHKESGKE
jgi:hypothetical protein